MAAVYSPKLLKARIEAIELPSKEKILPQAVCEKQIKTRRFAMPIYIEKFATAAVAVALAVFIGLQGIWLLNSKKDTRLLICADDNYNEGYLGDNWHLAITPDEEPVEKYLSNELSEKLQEYSGQDVLFRVIATRFEKDVTESQMSEFFNEIGAKNITNTIAESDIIKRDDCDEIIMEVTAEMIGKIAAKKQCLLILAPPKRVEGYNKKITDTLTERISKMDDKQIIEVAVVLTIDVKNNYAYKQAINANPQYNSEYIKSLDSFEYMEEYINSFGEKMYTTKSYDNAVRLLVESVIKRNGLNNKVVDYKKLPQNGCTEVKISYYSKNKANKGFKDALEYTIAGFNAVLTKSEILALTKDADVKAIYAAESRSNFTKDIWITPVYSQ